MFALNQALIVVIANFIALGLLYLYSFSISKHNYAGVLCLACLANAISFLFDINRFSTGMPLFLITWKLIFTLMATLLFYYALCSFLNKQLTLAPMWACATAIVWAGVLLSSAPSLILITLPLCVLNVILSLGIALMILLQDWEKDSLEKYIIAWGILFYGLHRSYYPFIKSDIIIAQLEYTTATLLTLIINICLLVLYFQHVQSDLAEQEKKFRLLAENARDFIFQYSLSDPGHFIYASPASTIIAGLEPQALYREPDIFFRNILDDDQQRILNFWRQPEKLEEAISFRYQRPDGRKIWLEQSNSILCDESGTPELIEGIIRDITERKAAEEKIIKIEESRRHLLANISHDLRTPITTIHGYVQALLDRVVSDQATTDSYLQLILRKAIGLNRLIQDLFDLSQIEAGKISLQLEFYPIAEVIQEINKYQLDIQAAGLTFEQRTGPNDLAKVEGQQILADIDRLDQVFANLIHNAIKNTLAPGKISVCFSSSPLEANSGSDASQQLLIEISDSGAGIAAKDLPYIFDRFYKCSKNRSSSDSGSGLGLSICQEIMALHKGDIFAHSDAGHGTTFFLSLPLYLSDFSRDQSQS
jgi:PAS domain S-box-containing protein